LRRLPRSSRTAQTIRFGRFFPRLRLVILRLIGRVWRSILGHADS
jgi:hypothetical protein